MVFEQSEAEDRRLRVVGGLLVLGSCPAAPHRLRVHPSQVPEQCGSAPDEAAKHGALGRGGAGAAVRRA
jgi:hypothetical protein